MSRVLLHSAAAIFSGRLPDSQKGAELTLRCGVVYCQQCMLPESINVQLQQQSCLQHPPEVCIFQAVPWQQCVANKVKIDQPELPTLH